MENEELFWQIISLIQRNPKFARILTYGNVVNKERLVLLYEILFAIDMGELEIARNEIFHYGSLIGKKDILARQIFLFLLFFTEEQEQLKVVS